MGILTEDMKRVVSEQRLGFIATVCPDGTPNVSPKGTTKVWDDDHLVFADIRSPATIKNLRANPAVEVNVVDWFLRKGYRFKGSATILTEGNLFDEILESYTRGLLSDAPYKIHCIVLIKVERALPLISPGYDEEVTEEEMRERYEGYYKEFTGRSLRPHEAP